MILLIDNFDSFTYNLVHAYQILGQQVCIMRNHVRIQEIQNMAPHLLILGPGPGNPTTAGISKACVLLGIPIFGVCLGHQIIAEVFGGTVRKAERVMHGKTSPIYHANTGVFTHLSQGFLGVRYHSLTIDPGTVPKTLQVTAWTPEEEIMGIRHRCLPIEGVQFHPESIASEEGMELLKNSLKLSVHKGSS